MATFIELVRQGKYTPHQIENWVDAWHNSETEQELHESIGMTMEQYIRWVGNPATLIPIMGEHGVVTEPEDLEIEGLKIEHNIYGEEQQSSFMNACLVGEHDVDVSIAATAPAGYHVLSPEEFNKAMQRDLAPLMAAGWSFEIQRGPDEVGREKLIDAMQSDIEG